MKKYLEILLQKLSSIFESTPHPGSWSSMRINSVLIPLIMVNAFTWVWVVLSLTNGRLEEVPENLVWLLSVVILITTTGKVGQKAIELIYRWKFGKEAPNDTKSE